MNIKTNLPDYTIEEFDMEEGISEIALRYNCAVNFLADHADFKLTPKKVLKFYAMHDFNELRVKNALEEMDLTSTLKRKLIVSCIKIHQFLSRSCIAIFNSVDDQKTLEHIDGLIGLEDVETNQEKYSLDV